MLELLPARVSARRDSNGKGYFIFWWALFNRLRDKKCNDCRYAGILKNYFMKCNSFNNFKRFGTSSVQAILAHCRKIFSPVRIGHDIRNWSRADNWKQAVLLCLFRMALKNAWIKSKAPVCGCNLRHFFFLYQITRKCSKAQQILPKTPNHKELWWTYSI